jgi:hypothetical protein
MSQTASTTVPDARSRGNDRQARPAQADGTKKDGVKPATSIAAEQSFSTGWDFLGFAFATADGFAVRFGIEQQVYLLKTTARNYNTLCSTLLACWLEGAKVSLEYRRPLISASADENQPMLIEGVQALRPRADGN